MVLYSTPCGRSWYGIIISVGSRFPGFEARAVQPSQRVLVLDYGSQYNLLITRRVRECGVYADLVDPDKPWEELAPHTAAVILSGGPNSVYEAGAPQLPPGLLESGLPILGICYGMQLLARALGGEVVAGNHREYGPARFRVEHETHLLQGLGTDIPCWMSHGDKVERLPEGFQALARTDTALAAMGNVERKVYGLQFHPEVSHTPQGTLILRNFLELAGCRFDWNAGSFVEESVAEIRAQVGEGRVSCALSGGVDSTVAAALVHKAVGDRLECLFVDNGLLRLHEAQEVMESLSEMGLNVRLIDARDRFMARLEGLQEPEAKRKAIGETFIHVFEEEGPRTDFLVQGTLYPDIVESGHGGAKKAVTIKTHHNVGGLPEGMRLKLVEPLKQLFKDEVRRVGRELGVPSAILERQPFPGPGLAVRCLGPLTQERLDTLRQADAIVRENLDALPLGTRPWQYYAALLPVRAVGVMGDARTYAEVIAVRAVHSEDAMTASVARLDWELLERISVRIVNEVKGVNRVVYDLTPKPPGTIEWE